MKPAEIAEISRYVEHFNQRFGQFLENALSVGVTNADMFYVTDEELLNACREYYRQYFGKRS